MEQIRQKLSKHAKRCFAITRDFDRWPLVASIDELDGLVGWFLHPAKVP